MNDEQHVVVIFHDEAHAWLDAVVGPFDDYEEADAVYNDATPFAELRRLENPPQNA